MDQKKIILWIILQYTIYIFINLFVCFRMSVFSSEDLFSSEFSDVFSIYSQNHSMTRHLF